MDIFDSWLVNNYIAHRGFHNSKSPENSISAFKNAIEKGYPIELDVQMIEDGTVVVFHDYTLKRMTNQDGYVANLKKEDLKKYKLGTSEEIIPTLKEVLKLIGGKVPVLVEIKNEGKVGKLEAQVIKLLKDYKGEYAVQSFNPFSLNYFYKNAPEILRGQLSGSLSDFESSRLVKALLKRMVFNKKYSKPNFIAYESKMMPTRFVKRFKNLPLIVWAVKTQEEYMNVIKYCDNIIFEQFEPKV